MTGALLFLGLLNGGGGLVFGDSENEEVVVGVVSQPDESADKDSDEKSAEVNKPVPVREQEARDESGLPTEAFNPMKLYEIDADGDARAAVGVDVGPKFDPGAVVGGGVIRWPYLTVNVTEKYIDIEGVVGINEGFLEQVVCLPGTRGHESLVIAFARPSHIHAALLLLGLEPGKPGKWVAVEPNAEDEKWSYRVIPPDGAKVRVTIIYKKIETETAAEIETGTGAVPPVSPGFGEGVEGGAGKVGEELVEVEVREWVVDYRTGKLFPQGPWVFGGSAMKKDFTETERYLADLTGSIMGVVTFGDELLGWNEVWPDQEGILEPEWVCNTKVMPAWNTGVVVRIRPWDAADTNAENDAAGAEASGGAGGN